MPVLPGQGHLAVGGPGDSVDDLLLVVEVGRGLEEVGTPVAAGRDVGHVHIDDGVGAAGLGVPESRESI